MSEAGLRLDREGAVVTLALSRPRRRNAIDRATWRHLGRLCIEIERDPGIRLVLVRGDGGTFSAGADIAEFAEVFADEAAAQAYNDMVQQALGRLERLDRPTIAVIEGDCIGGGCGLAVACDLRFAADNARLGITPARLGLAYSLDDIRRLVALIGVARSKDLLFSARLLDAPEAFRFGLVDRVVPQAELQDTVGNYVRTLTALSGNSQLLIKAMLLRVAHGQTADDAESLALRDGAITHVDFAEGRRAFLERRPPRFTGRAPRNRA